MARKSLRPAVSAVASTSRDALITGYHAARAAAETAYVSYPHADAFARAWQTTAEVPGWLAQSNAAVLFEIIQAIKPKVVVEIGSYLGRSTVLMALGQLASGVSLRA